MGKQNTCTCHDLNWGALNHASHAPQLMSCNYYVYMYNVHVSICVCMYMYMYVLEYMYVHVLTKNTMLIITVEN